MLAINTGCVSTPGVQCAGVRACVRDCARVHTYIYVCVHAYIYICMNGFCV